MTRQSIIAIICAAALLAAGPATAGEAPQGAIENGIQVHGHWKIEIFEPDGTLVSSTEFENALVPTDGSGMLAPLLVGGSISVGGWQVKLESSSGGACNYNANPYPCLLGESDLQFGASGPTNLVIHSSNLTAQFLSVGLEYAIELSGTVVSENSATINSVTTFVKYCGDSIAPANCAAETYLYVEDPFTATTLASPPTVQAGQVIQVTVTMSFS